MSFLTAFGAIMNVQSKRSLSRVDVDNAQLDGELRHELFSDCGYDPWLQIWANTRNDRYPMMIVWSRR